MKIPILTKDTKEQPYWTNFRMLLGKADWPHDALVEQYNAGLVINGKDDAYIKFNNDIDATLFLLRWS
jgi:hypothetical protein